MVNLSSSYDRSIVGNLFSSIDEKIFSVSLSIFNRANDHRSWILGGTHFQAFLFIVVSLGVCPCNAALFFRGGICTQEW